MDNSKPYMYEHYTWPEMRDQVMPRAPVVLQPVGSVEQHGHHLPIDVDNYIIWRACQEVGSRIPDEVLVMPLIPYGFETHHGDFPATIMIKAEHFIGYVLDVCKSLAHHGFRRILLVDGHGSNLHLLDQVARRTVLETEALCATFIWTSLVKQVASELRESTVPGGMSHACELETSVYLYLDPSRVQMDKAMRDISFPSSEFIWSDLMESSPVLMMNWWSRVSRTGVIGDPTVASAAKGEKIYAHLIERMIALVREFGGYEPMPRRDHH